MIEQKLKTQEFILTLIHIIELNQNFEKNFFMYLSAYNSEMYEKLFLLYTADNDFFSTIQEGLKYTDNPYDEHLFSQLLICRNKSFDFYTVLTDTVIDLEHL